MIVVTGGAGFIGSALVWGLNQRGRSDVLVVDDVDHEEKEHNLAELEYEELVGIKEFRAKLLAGDYPVKPADAGHGAGDSGVEAVLHMGACSATTETDWDYLEDNNVEYSKDIIRWCFDGDVRCVYASSAATYGDGAEGYSDDPELFDALKPLNLYGKSKLLVDIWARDGKYFEGGIAGVRYFNVFGPNEWHKEGMRSVIAKKFEQIKADGFIELFASNDPEYKDGEQKRDFVYIKDVVDATLWLMENKETAGVFNVGAGAARTWNAVANAMFSAMGKKPDIRYIELPDQLKNQYQNFTQADITKLREAGYQRAFTSLEDAAVDYITNYLTPHLHLTT